MRRSSIVCAAVYLCLTSPALSQSMEVAQATMGGPQVTSPFSQFQLEFPSGRDLQLFDDNHFELNENFDLQDDASQYFSPDDYVFVAPDWADDQMLLQRNFLEQVELDCAACYPAPQIAPFPRPRPKRPFGGLIQGNVLNSSTPATPVEIDLSVTQWQIALARQVTQADVCNAVLTGLLKQTETCDADAKFESNDTYVSVISGGEVLPVFLVHAAAKSPRLSLFHASAFEAHRYYVGFVLDLDLNMQILTFDYEPLFNTGSEMRLVLNRNQVNTEYIDTNYNESINDLTSLVRAEIFDMITALAGE